MPLVDYSSLARIAGKLREIFCEGLRGEFDTFDYCQIRKQPLGRISHTHSSRNCSNVNQLSCIFSHALNAN